MNKQPPQEPPEPSEPPRHSLWRGQRPRLPVLPSYPAQVDPTTCGISALAAASYRAGVLPTYATSDARIVASIQERLHIRASTTGMPWPRALGTSPWALAALATTAVGIPYRVRLWTRATVDKVDAALEAGRDVFLYSGGDGRAFTRWIPRHVVLALGPESVECSSESAHYAIFEPSSGRTHKVARDEIDASTPAARRALGNWHHLLMAVLPPS